MEKYICKAMNASEWEAYLNELKNTFNFKILEMSIDQDRLIILILKLIGGKHSKMNDLEIENILSELNRKFN